MATAREWACGAIAALAIMPAVFAQSTRSDTAGARLGVAGYAIEGQPLLRAEDFTRIVAPFVGRQKSAVDVDLARVALQQAYHDLGHCAIRIDAPTSLSPDGVATFQVNEVGKRDDRNCLPAVALDGRRVPANSQARDAAGRGSSKSAAQDLSTATSRSIAATAPNAAGPNVIAASYVEGGGGRGLTLSLDGRGPNEEKDSSGGGSGREKIAVKSPAVALAMSDAVSAIPAAASPPASASTAKLPPRALPTPTATEPENVRAAGPVRVQVAQAPAAQPTEAAPASDSAPPKFEIRTYVVEGNSLLSREKINSVLGPFTGKNKDFGDVQRALEALQNAYQEAGFGSVEIRLPEQELERGEVKFVAIEAKIGKVTVEGNEHFTSANIRRSVPGLREGETPNSRDIAQSIRLANENPAKQSTVLLKGAEQEGQIDATIRVADIPPTRYSISLDNTGNENTGRSRLGFAYQNANMFDRDHIFTAQIITTPLNYHDVGVFGLGYKIPMYKIGDSIDIVAGYSDVNSGVVQDLFNVTGKGAVYALRYNQGLSKMGDIEHRIAYGIDYRAYQNNVNPLGGNANLVPDITIHPFSATYFANLRQEQREYSLFLSFVQNIEGGNDGTDDIFKKARFQEGTAGYRLFRFGGTFSRSFLGDWQARIRLDSQYSDDALVTGEQFAIGGADNVRGFPERFTSNDKGYRTNWEIYSPDWGKQLGLGDGRLRFLTFYDTGVTYRNQTLPGEHYSTSLDSWGGGLRFSHKNYFTLRLDVAHVLHDGTQSLVPDGRRNLTKVHFSSAIVW